MCHINPKKEKVVLVVSVLYRFIGIFSLLIFGLDLSHAKSNKQPLSLFDAITEARPLSPEAKSTLEKYSLGDLGAAAIAMRESLRLAEEKPDKSSSPFGCRLTAEETDVQIFSLMKLVSQKVTEDRIVYAADPDKYGQSNKFDTCASNCSCGVFIGLTQSIESTKLKKTLQEAHRRNIDKLVAQNGSVDERKCSQQQTWICKSDLMKFLAQDAKSRPSSSK